MDQKKVDKKKKLLKRKAKTEGVKPSKFQTSGAFSFIYLVCWTSVLSIVFHIIIKNLPTKFIKDMEQVIPAAFYTMPFMISVILNERGKKFKSKLNTKGVLFFSLLCVVGPALVYFLGLPF